MASSKLLEAIAITAEICGRTFTPAAAAVFAQDLEGYPEPALLAALARCRKELAGQLTLAHVIARIEDGRPGPEEAWALVPKSEDESAVWTSEIAEAFAAASPLLKADQVAARMAFKEAYVKLLAEARAAKRPPVWQATLGHDPRGRERALFDAMARGRLSLESARKIMPDLPAPGQERGQIPAALRGLIRLPDWKAG